MIEKISPEKQTAMLIRKYDISDKLDNTVIGVFIGIISGIKIDALMNNENNIFKLILLVCCIVAVGLLIAAIFINSSFIAKCLDSAIGRSYRNSETIKKEVAKQNRLTFYFWFCLSLSLIIFSFGIGVYKFNSANIQTTAQIICPCHVKATDSNENFSHTQTQIESDIVDILPTE